MDAMTDGQVLRFYDNPEGERYVNLVDVVCWCHEYAKYLVTQGKREGADAVAGVGLAMADELEPEE